jgi:hypothetical protein
VPAPGPKAQHQATRNRRQSQRLGVVPPHPVQQQHIPVNREAKPQQRHRRPPHQRARRQFSRITRPRRRQRRASVQHQCSAAAILPPSGQQAMAQPRRQPAERAPLLSIERGQRLRRMLHISSAQAPAVVQPPTREPVIHLRPSVQGRASPHPAALVPLLIIPPAPGMARRAPGQRRSARRSGAARPSKRSQPGRFPYRRRSS